MILQSLYDYYQRKSADVAEHGGEALAPSGWEWKEIPFVLVVDSAGKLVKIEDRRDEKGKRATPSLVPQAVKKSSGIAANLLWDNPEYVLGYVAEGKKPERIATQHQAFIKKIREYFPDPTTDKSINAVLAFLSNNPLGQATARTEWQEVEKAKNANFAFQLDGEMALAHESQAVRKVINSQEPEQESEAPSSYCLITGKQEKIARLHPPIKGVSGTQTTGGNIVSFNLDAFRSYGKHQGNNAPVSEEAANTYATALNYLLRKDSPQKLQLGDTTTTVWWAEKSEGGAEELLGFCFGGLGRDNPDERSAKIRSLVQGIWKGNLHKDVESSRFYILGLAPNAARIAIRFFDVYTVECFGENIARYFQEIALPYFEEHHYPPLPGLCAAITATGKTDQLPQNFPGEMFYRIVKGLPYPKLWFYGAIRRTRATQDVTPYLAAIVKACLIRNYNRKEVSMTVDENNREIGYLLGRLFAVYDKLKEEETKQTSNRRDKFFSAVSSRPQAVFFRVAQLAEYDLKKLRRSKETRGLAITREKQILKLQSLLGQPLTTIPSTLEVEQQAWFALGFYHQRQEFFIKHQETTEQKNAA